MNTETENVLAAVRISCWHLSGSMDAADRCIAPLVWYVATGRSSAAFNRALCKLHKRQICTIAKKLYACNGMEYGTAISAVKSYLRRTFPESSDSI